MRRLLLVPALVILLTAAADARTIRPLPENWEKGMNVVAFRWDHFSGDRFYYWMRQLRRRANVDHAVFSLRWIQYWRDPLRGDDVAATDINPAYGSAQACRRHPKVDYTRCQTPSTAALRKALLYAKELGMEVGIKPLVDVGRNGRTAVGRERVAFTDDAERARWFDSYRAMMAEYARLARDVGAEQLIIGTGLTKMADGLDDQAHWRRLIDDIRSGLLMGDDKGGFTGRLTYAARWDDIFDDAQALDTHDFFWDALDVIGVEGFWPLIGGKDPDHDNPSVGRLRDGWRLNFLKDGLPPGIALRNLNAEYDKPVVLTGLGYLSRGGTSAAPFNGDYAQAAVGGKVNETAQARPYRAAFDFWSGVARTHRWFRGIYWWNWQPKLGTVRNNGDYTPQGKPAERELCLRHLGRDTKACRPSGMPN